MKTEEVREILDFVKNMAVLYFGRYNMSELPEYMEERTSWIGTGRNEISRNLSEAKKALEQDMTQYGGGFSEPDINLELVPISDVAFVVYGELKALPADQELSVEELRISVVLERVAGKLKLVHMHFSRADEFQEMGHYFVPQSARADNRSLRLALDERERQLAQLTQNIPGGVHQCANDYSLTLLSMSDGFLSMVGYTREEIKAMFRDKFINMIYPGDRAALLKSTHGQTELGGDMELEYRVLRKGGEPIWVLDKCRLIEDNSGRQCFYCLLMEITDRKRQQEELRLSLERHQVIMDQAEDIIFEWDIEKDTLSFSTNWYKKFGYEAIDSKISNRIPLSANIHPDDMAAFMKIMRDTAAGVSYSETEFRIKDCAGQYYWCRIRATTQYNADGCPIKAVGVIVDIDTEKKQKQELLAQAQRDALTGIYNKATLQTMVEQRLGEKGTSEYQALLIIDVDHFKAVNDTYGHLCGDSVLSDVAVALKSGIRSTDLVGRIGGDEFMIYLPEILDEAAVHQKTAHLLDLLGAIVPRAGSEPISCSIGAAVFPRGSIDYYGLYKCADQALYQRKNNGRGGVSFFGLSADSREVPCGKSPTAVGGDIVSERNTVLDEALAQYAFRTLYNATDTAATIDRLLEIVGRSFDVSRAYIFESSEDGQCCSNTFEWCNEGVSYQIDKLQDIAYVDELGDYITNFDKEGMFYCHDIETLHPNLRAVLKPQGIRSMLQCAMLDEGRFVGYMGFDECRENRSWNDRQVASFKLTADVISVFVMKLRLKQRMTDNLIYIEEMQIQ